MPDTPQPRSAPTDAPEGLPPDHEDRRRILEQLDTTLLVEAGAGTGKTTSMIGRMVALLREGRCRIDTLAAVTFTRKSAAEMRARFQVELERAARQEPEPGRQRLLDGVAHLERCFIGTIHSFCARLLRERPIEAGVDLAFEELDPDTDAQLLEQAWREVTDELLDSDDGLAQQLVERGLDIEHLKPAYQSYALYPDVDTWPAPQVQPGNLQPVVQALEDYLRHMETLLPTFPVSRGNDKLMNQYESIVRQARQLDLQRPADLMNLLEKFGSHGAIQKQWPQGAQQGKAERDRWLEFVDRYAQPNLERWKEVRYSVVLGVLERARARYDQLRTASGGLNYQDLLLRAAQLLQHQPAIRHYFRRRFTHLCVDEFQDTDPVQAQMMMTLVADDIHQTDWKQCRPVPGSLFVVGDPKQSIYRFRRADIVTYNRVKQIILDSGGAVVALTANFRTTGELVTWGNEIFDQVFPPQADAYSPGQRAMLIGRQGDGDGQLSGVGRLTVPREHGQAAAVVEHEADRIARYIRHALDTGLTLPRTTKELQQGVPAAAQPGDFLIVTRQKWNLAVFARKLQELEIPHQVTGSSALNQVPQLKQLAGCLAALVEPDNPVALVAVLRGPLFGFSDEALFTFRQAGGRFSYRAPLPAPLPPEVSRQFDAAYGRLQRYASWLNRLPVLAAFEQIAADLGLTAQAAAGAGGEFQAGTMAKAFEMLRGAQDQLPSAADLAERLTELIEQKVEFDGLPARPPAESVVRVMNLHKVKGLEAPVVLLADATGDKSREPGLHIDRAGDTTRGYLAVFGPRRGWSKPPLLARPGGWEHFAEEEKKFTAAEQQRLHYVAATRAGSQLTVSQRASSQSKNPWQFFDAHVPAAQELPDPGPQNAPAQELVVVQPADVETARDAIAARWETVEQESYLAAAAKEISITPSSLHHVAASGEHGTEWGTVIHFLLETAMRNPQDDLNDMARMALAEQQLDPALSAAAVNVVRQVIRSELWQRAQQSQQRLMEVPFETRLVPDEGAEPLPTLLRGVIDLAFLEDDGWVLVDYKTDAGAEQRLTALTEHYRGQIEIYGRLWQQMVGQPVKEMGLYFTTNGQYVTV